MNEWGISRRGSRETVDEKESGLVTQAREGGDRIGPSNAAVTAFMPGCSAHHVSAWSWRIFAIFSRQQFSLLRFKPLQIAQNALQDLSPLLYAFLRNIPRQGFLC